MSVAKRLLEMNKRDPKRQEWGEALGFFQPKSKLFTVKKGDIVKLKTGEEGKIIKYPSNSEITIQTSDNLMVVSKDEIDESN